MRHSTLKPYRHDTREFLAKEKLLSEEAAAVADWKEKIEGHLSRMDEIIEEMRSSNSNRRETILAKMGAAPSRLSLNETTKNLF